MHRHDIARLEDVVAVEQLTRRGVARDVHLSVALVHHVGAEFGQQVDYSEHRVLIARNQRRSKDDGVALGNLDVVLEVRHAREHRHRLALRTRRHVDDLVFWNRVGVL